MTKNWDIFPKSQPVGDGLANLSCYKIYEKCAIAGYGVISGCAVSRNSATQVDVASGVYTVSGVRKNYAGGNVSGISAADAGKQRYDLFYIDGADDTLKTLTGTQDTPTNALDFLENYVPRPAEPTDTDWVILAVVRVTENGVENTNFGTNSYATGSVANMRMSPAFCVDDSTLQVVDGVASVKASYARIYGPYRITHDGGASQSIMTTGSLCTIVETVVKCVEVTDTATYEIGWAGDSDALVESVGMPSILNDSNTTLIFEQLKEVKNIIATVGGSGTTGEIDVWFLISEYS